MYVTLCVLFIPFLLQEREGSLELYSMYNVTYKMAQEGGVVQAVSKLCAGSELRMNFSFIFAPSTFDFLGYF